VSRILCIDDELGLRRLLRRVLEPEGYVVATAADGASGLHRACTEEWDLVILDLLLPDMPGTAVLSALLETRPTQRVLVLSALGDTESRVTCLERGAVDYLGKPFVVREFTARVRSRLAEPGPILGAAIVSPAGLELDMARHRCTWGGRTTELSPREFLLVQYLLRRHGSVCSRGELLREVWGYAFDPGSNVVDVTIGRLRQKLGGGLIETIRNVGYAIAV
jgi:DNA-binding response OmpR family regulator